MPEIQLVKEEPLTLSELKSKLDQIKKRDKELSFRANKTHEYLTVFASMQEKKSQELKKKLQDLNISRLKDKHIAKIIDLYPKNSDDLKVILSGENLTLKQEDLQRILECLK